jgi:hypothetical protein
LDAFGCVVLRLAFINIFREQRKEEKKKKECLYESEVEGCVKVLQTKISIL